MDKHDLCSQGMCICGSKSSIERHSTWPYYCSVQVYEAEANMGTEAAARDQLSQQLVSL